MKKLTVLSIIAASLILTGCGESSTGAEAKASSEKAPVAQEAKAEKTMKCGEGKCGGDKKSAATEAKEAAAVAVSKATEAVKEKVEEVKAKASDAIDSAKTAVASATTAAKEAVAKVTAPDGKAIFAKCAGCHGADGKTKALGKSEIISGQSEADLEKKITEYKAGTRNTKGMGALMKGQVGGLSDAEVKAVATYISGL